MTETYWNGGAADTYNRRIPMTLLSRKMGVRLLVAAVIIIAAVTYFLRGRSSVAQYVTAAATQGDIVQAVTATGTVNPVVTVQVGTYVSGPIVQMLCDFNTQVKKGQLCAKIDPSTYQVTLDQAQANLANGIAQLNKDQAALDYAKVTYERDQRLILENVISQDALDSQKATYEAAVAQVGVDRASILQQQASVRAAKVNLGYTNIISPVDGTVVARNVDMGQTVAASFQTPTLFLIAQDLTKMQVDTNVSESDVGPVQVGQKAGFTVDAFPDRTFWGSVAQVRQSPITVQNVVTYDVVIAVSNPELLLKPGMTANARIVTAERDDVLRCRSRRCDFLLPAPRSIRIIMVEAGRAKPRAQIATGMFGCLMEANFAASTWFADSTTAAMVEIVSGDLKAGDQVVIDQVNAAAGRYPAAGRSSDGIPHHL